MDNPKVSVIIPVYNTEKYVEEAVRSIMNQTLFDIEIIVIDDGSTDNSLQVVNELQKIDNRIHIYTQKNKGQSTARNSGLNHAKGMYIYFMDSDDILHADALRVCYEKCVSEDLDFTFFDAKIFSNNNLSLPISYDRKGKIKIEAGPGLKSLNTLVDTAQYSPSVCLLFINRDYINSINLSFQSGITHEDQIFTAKLFSLANKVTYIPETFFYRRLRPGSIMTKPYSIFNVKNYFIVADNLKAFASLHDSSVEETLNKTIRFIFDPAIYMANVLKLKERLSIAKTCVIHYRKFISIKSWLVLLFPWLIKLKSYIK